MELQIACVAPVIAVTFAWEPTLDSPEAIVAYLEAVFEIGEPELIQAALGDVARVRGVTVPVVVDDLR